MKDRHRLIRYNFLQSNYPPPNNTVVMQIVLSTYTQGDPR